MSFTVMRYKDGVPERVKMSIWDAFKGAPPPRKPKTKLVSYAQPVADSNLPLENVPAASEVPASVPVRCPCCHKVHSPGEFSEGGESENKKTDENKMDKDSKDNEKSAGKVKSGDATNKSREDATANGGKKDDKGKDDKKNHDVDNSQNPSRSTKEEETYSEKDNETMLAMKAEGKTWAEILEALGKKSASQAKAHWKTIDPKKHQEKNGKQNDETAKEDAGKKDEKQGKQKAKQGEGKKGAGDRAKKSDSSAKSGAKADEGMLRGWSDRYDRQKWMAAASRHFDLTGQRITPATAKRIAEGK